AVEFLLTAKIGDKELIKNLPIEIQSSKESKDPPAQVGKILELPLADKGWVGKTSPWLRPFGEKSFLVQARAPATKCHTMKFPLPRGDWVLTGKMKGATSEMGEGTRNVPVATGLVIEYEGGVEGIEVALRSRPDGQTGEVVARQVTVADSGTEAVAGGVEKRSAKDGAGTDVLEFEIRSSSCGIEVSTGKEGGEASWTSSPYELWERCASPRYLHLFIEGGRVEVQSFELRAN
ncbi:MAG: hypothetical protein AAF517_16995, partial [Planctomycetota bacterium]